MGYNKKDRKIFKEQQEKRERKPFTDVDVWQTHFGKYSARAVYDVYSAKFNISEETMKRKPRLYTFSHCVNALRKLEDPDYVAPTDTSR